MKLVHFLMIARVALTTLAISQAQVAGSTLLGVSVLSCVTPLWIGAPTANPRAGDLQQWTTSSPAGLN
jgi:hypothetical protein